MNISICRVVTLGLLAAVTACNVAQEKQYVEDEFGNVSTNLTADDCKEGRGCSNPTWTYSPSWQNPARVPDANYCKDYSCGKGEGDCDSNSECKSGHVCVHDRGAFVGLPSNYDICWPSADVCNDLGPCRAGEGDCDDSPGRQGPRECVEGAVCIDGSGSESCTTRNPDNLDSFLDGFNVGAPGFGAAVFDEEGMVAIGVSGKRVATSSTQIKKTDRFHLGSNTKAMTATLAAVLEREGLVEWTDKYNFTGRHSNYAGVTLLDYLGHRGGLPANVTYPTQSTSLKSRRQTLSQNVLSSAAPNPVGQYFYSNVSYIVAASLLEKATGQSYENLMQEYILDPLGMDSCGWGPSPDVSGHVFQFDTSGNAWWEVNNGDNPPVMNPAGRMHCSLEDYGKFIREHLRGNRSALLPQSSYNVMHTPPSSGTAYQAGWGISPRAWADGNSLSHAGSNTLNYAVAWLGPNADIAVVAVANAANTFPTNTASALDSIVANLLGTYAN